MSLPKILMTGDRQIIKTKVDLIFRKKNLFSTRKSTLNITINVTH